MLAGRTIDLSAAGTTAGLIQTWNPYDGSADLSDWLRRFAPGRQQSSDQLAVLAGSRRLALFDTGRIIDPFDPTDPMNRITLVRAR
jgi:hypothetical protein